MSTDNSKLAKDSTVKKLDLTTPPIEVKPESPINLKGEKGDHGDKGEPGQNGGVGPEGLSLRNYYASQALIGLVNHAQYAGAGEVKCAEAAFRYADEMMRLSR